MRGMKKQELQKIVDRLTGESFEVEIKGTSIMEDLSDPVSKIKPASLCYGSKDIFTFKIKEEDCWNLMVGDMVTVIMPQTVPGMEIKIKITSITYDRLNNHERVREKNSSSPIAGA